MLMDTINKLIHFNNFILYYLTLQDGKHKD